MSIVDKFGFLPFNERIDWEHGSVVPLPDLDRSIQGVADRTHPIDRFVYPERTPDRARRHLGVEGHTGVSDATERPALLHKLPVTHELHLRVAPVDPVFRDGDGAFLVHFLGYLFGVRLQFSDWWHDGRIYLGGRQGVALHEANVSRYLSEAYATWRGWPLRIDRKRFTNVLYLHARAPTYEWDWERFMMYYMVLDGCYSVAASVHGWPRIRRHADRFRKLLSHHRIPFDDADASILVRLRNELLHETLWGSGQPCSGMLSGDRIAADLRRINERVIAGLSGLRTSYITSNWETLGSFAM